MKTIYCIILLCLIIFTSCSILNAKLGLPDDNPFEETIEFAIEAETGLKIDLTPGD